VGRLGLKMYVPKEKNHSLKNPGCTEIYHQTFKKFDQTASQLGAVVNASAPRRGAI